MLEFDTAALIATAIACIPLAIVARSVYFGLISGQRFHKTYALIEVHHQPNNDDGDPIQLRLRYSYRVGDKDYTGRRYYFGSRNECDSELLARYPQGSTQAVFYDPHCPSRSTLQVGFHPRLWFWIVTALICCPILWVALAFGMVIEWK